MEKKHTKEWMQDLSEERVWSSSQADRGEQLMPLCIPGKVSRPVVTISDMVAGFSLQRLKVNYNQGQ